MLEFKNNGHSFRVEKMNAFGQLHLSRKVSPLLPALAPVILRYKSFGGKMTAEKLLSVAEIAAPFAHALASMSNEDAEQVMSLALSSVKVLTDENKDVWVPLWVPGATRAAVMELDDLGQLLPVVIRVISFNLGNFIDALLTRHGEGNKESSGEASRAVKTS